VQTGEVLSNEEGQGEWMRLFFGAY